MDENKQLDQVDKTTRRIEIMLQYELEEIKKKQQFQTLLLLANSFILGAIATYLVVMICK